MTFPKYTNVFWLSEVFKIVLRILLEAERMILCAPKEIPPFDTKAKVFIQLTLPYGLSESFSKIIPFQTKYISWHYCWLCMLLQMDLQIYVACYIVHIYRRGGALPYKLNYMIGLCVSIYHFFSRWSGFYMFLISSVHS